jgi:uncharacterized protein (TIGR00106 family)
LQNLQKRKGKDGSVVIAEVSIFPLGTGTPGVSEYVKVAVRELEASGLKCTLGPMGTTVEAETTEEAYAAIARAQAAVFELGVGRAYTVVKMDERRDVEGPLHGGHARLGPQLERLVARERRSPSAALVPTRYSLGVNSELTLLLVSEAY